MNVGFPWLFVAAFSLATLPQTVACSPIWFLASGAEILGASVELRANIADDAFMGEQPSRPTMQLSKERTAMGTEMYPFCITLSLCGKYTLDSILEVGQWVSSQFDVSRIPSVEISLLSHIKKHGRPIIGDSSEPFVY
jgi:hypothetical protein